MKSTLLAFVISLSALLALGAPPTSGDQRLAQNDSGTSDQQNHGKGNAKGKGKGKAKGHNKDREASAAESSKAQPSTAPAEAAASPAPAPSAPTSAESKESVSSAPARSAKEIKADFEKRLRQVNTLDNHPAAAKAGLEAIARETGVPLSTLQAQIKDHKAGSGGLVMANELAKATGKPAVTFLRQRQQNREWDRIAADNKFDLSKVLPKLDRVQASMEAAQKTKKR